MTESNNRRESLRSCPTPRVRPVLRPNAVLLYTVGHSIPKSDHHELEDLLDRFHSSEELQALICIRHKCTAVPPKLGDSRPARLQLVNHCCEPDNNAVCEEYH
jgi:hypothetical protein